jgi:hypothetical protein
VGEIARLPLSYRLGGYAFAFMMVSSDAIDRPMARRCMMGAMSLYWVGTCLCRVSVEGGCMVYGRPSRNVKVRKDQGRKESGSF